MRGQMTVKRIPEPTENGNTGCHLQKHGKVTLICQAAKGRIDKVNRTICFNCDVGKIFRETGCDWVFPKLQIIPMCSGAKFNALPKDNQLSTHYHLNITSMFCRRYERETTLDLCRTCDPETG